MKCNKCGYETEQDFVFCPTCGEEQKKEPEINTAAEKIFPALKDNLFLAICILQTVAAAISVMTGSVNVINILLAVFMWLVYSKAKEGTVDVKSMRYVSGTVYALYVVVDVVCIIFVVVGLLCGVWLGLLGQSIESLGFINITVMGKNLSQFVGASAVLLGWLVMIVMCVVGSVGYAINRISLRKIHRLAQTAYQSVQAGNVSLIENAQAAKTWLWVLGVLSAVSALNAAINPLSFIATGCEAASTVIAAVLVGKYLLDGK